ncbi:MAG: alpha-glucosidase [Lachnobacterium sp.]|nr:alpha-glucosidase [Lachnobacterium sp.]MDY5461285.1 alpha-glucosidase [Agathobacter sp.]
MKKKWWMGKVAYQIWPKSFADSNGDGVGDLEGIIGKLDYLKDLGIDIIWISPLYKSPLVDQGYDISDYYDINPLFGDLETMDRLLAEAKKRDMYIVMDLVVNHCSDEHEWFKKACADPDGEYGKYFYIAEKKDGKLPCNWRSYFGGSVWEPIPGTDKYYFHAFHKKQPDLNWENPKVRQEVYKMMNWWFERGIAGFRIDAIINIKKKLPFCDYEPDRDDGMVSIVRMLEDAEGIGEFLEEMKHETFDKYDAFTVGEVFNEKDSELREFIGENGHFSSKFDFAPEICGKGGAWYEHETVTPEMYKNAIFDSQLRVADIGFLSNIIENHDEPRGVCRYIPDGDLNDTSKKALAAVYFFLRGIPFIYQGQEIGMENCPFESIDQIDDISSKDEYKVCRDAGYSEEESMKLLRVYSRDNARTPVQWSDEENAGFSTHKPWMIVNPNYREINLAKQKDDRNSVYAFYKKMIALYKDPAYHETLTFGRFEPYMRETKNLIAYYRKGEGQTLLVLANFQNEPQTVMLPEAAGNVILNNCASVDVDDNGRITLGGYQAVMIEL